MEEGRAVRVWVCWGGRREERGVMRVLSQVVTTPGWKVFALASPLFMARPTFSAELGRRIESTIPIFE